MNKKVVEFINKNSSNILTTCGLVSLLSGTAIACKSSISIYNNVKKMKEEKTDGATIIKKNIKYTIAPTLLLIGGSVMVIAANKVNNKKIAALASAYTSTSLAFNQFKEKTAEVVKTNQLEKIRSEVSDDAVKNNYKGEKSIIITGKGDCIIFEPQSKQYIRSNWNEIAKTANELNADCIEHGGTITLNTWLTAIGADTIGVGNLIEWNPREIGNQLKIEKTTSITPDDQPCLCIHYANEPTAIK